MRELEKDQGRSRAVHTYSFQLTPPEGAAQKSHQPRSSKNTVRALMLHAPPRMIN
jgi:hypothetical protein